MHINNDFDILYLDLQALLRPGRFDRHITIDYPTLAERKDIFEMYLRTLKLKTQSAELPGKLSQLTPGMSGMVIS
jgi:ATP-dependent Zn protease